ncbi:hypothetical protein DIPPA_25809 [Diplonema papillatum]|nr:hypothetical protein DIPPA_25809 [Diplonema papillatum]
MRSGNAHARREVAREPQDGGSLGLVLHGERERGPDEGGSAGGSVDVSVKLLKGWLEAEMTAWVRQIHGLRIAMLDENAAAAGAYCHVLQQGFASGGETAYTTHNPCLRVLASTASAHRRAAAQELSLCAERHASMRHRLQRKEAALHPPSHSVPDLPDPNGYDTEPSHRQASQQRRHNTSDRSVGKTLSSDSDLRSTIVINNQLYAPVVDGYVDTRSHPLPNPYTDGLDRRGADVAVGDSSDSLFAPSRTAQPGVGNAVDALLDPAAYRSLHSYLDGSAARVLRLPGGHSDRPPAAAHGNGSSFSRAGWAGDSRGSALPREQVSVHFGRGQPEFHGLDSPAREQQGGRALPGRSGPEQGGQGHAGFDGEEATRPGWAGDSRGYPEQASVHFGRGEPETHAFEPHTREPQGGHASAGRSEGEGHGWAGDRGSALPRGQPRHPEQASVHFGQIHAFESPGREPQAGHASAGRADPERGEGEGHSWPGDRGGQPPHRAEQLSVGFEPGGSQRRRATAPPTWGGAGRRSLRDAPSPVGEAARGDAEDPPGGGGEYSPSASMPTVSPGSEACYYQAGGDRFATEPTFGSRDFAPGNGGSLSGVRPLDAGVLGLGDGGQFEASRKKSMEVLSASTAALSRAGGLFSDGLERRPRGSRQLSAPFAPWAPPSVFGSRNADGGLPSAVSPASSSSVAPIPLEQLALQTDEPTPSTARSQSRGHSLPSARSPPTIPLGAPRRQTSPHFAAKLSPTSPVTSSSCDSQEIFQNSWVLETLRGGSDGVK